MSAENTMSREHMLQTIAQLAHDVLKFHMDNV